ncbi:MAG: methyltransferase domain-containing protein [Holosporaceae bacterium]|jgi:SAM-dependent methyltransferase|nr:methyltransferase domain-containing protein [Holosporaceae bacterium]
MKANLFNEAAETYDSVSDVQVLSAARLVEMIRGCLSSSDVESIVDIGCGTGNASLELMKYYSTAEYFLCDISPRMIEKAREKIARHCNVRYFVADAERRDFAERYSLGISNLAMQWFESIDAFLEKILKNCRYFAFSIPTDESFSSLDLSSALIYPPVEKIKRVCEKCGEPIEFSTKKFELQFENSFALARYFRKLGAAAHSSIKSPPRGKTTLDYEIFFAIVRRRGANKHD